jgi:hypothetical protein
MIEIKSGNFESGISDFEGGVDVAVPGMDKTVEVEMVDDQVVNEEVLDGQDED